MIGHDHRPGVDARPEGEDGADEEPDARRRARRSVSHFSCWRSRPVAPAEAQDDRDGAQADAGDEQGEADPAEHREERRRPGTGCRSGSCSSGPGAKASPAESTTICSSARRSAQRQRGESSTPSGKRSGSSHSSTVVNGTQAKLAIHAARSSCGRDADVRVGTSAEYESVSTITPALSTRPANMAPIGLPGRRR